MASTWQRALATAKLVLALHSSTVVTEQQAVEYIKSLIVYDRNQLEQRLRDEGDNEAAAWVRGNG